MAWYWWAAIAIVSVPVMFAAIMGFCYWRVKSIERQMEAEEPGSVEQMKARMRAAALFKELGRRAGKGELH